MSSFLIICVEELLPELRKFIKSFLESDKDPPQKQTDRLEKHQTVGEKIRSRLATTTQHEEKSSQSN